MTREPMAGLEQPIPAPPAADTGGRDAARVVARWADQRFGGFIDTQVNPGTIDRDASGTPLEREVLREAARRGLLGLTLPAEVGGEGIDLFTWGITLEEIAYRCEDLSFPLVVSLYAAVASVLEASGRPDLVERYVVPVVRGERLVSFAYSEERDAFSFTSTAVRDGDAYVLNGRKVIVTGGLMADAFMTYVPAEDGRMLTIMVERGDRGVDVTPVRTMGVRAAGLARLGFTGVRVPADRVVVEGDGLGHVQRFLNQRRLLLSCGAVGRMRWAVEACVRMLRETERYGMPLTDMQAVQAKLGRLVVAVETSRLVAHEGLRRLACGDYDAIWDPHLSAAKYYLTEQALAVGNAVLHLTGGRGYEATYGFERYMRDVTGLIAGSGAQDVLEIDLGIWLSTQAMAHDQGGSPS